MAFPLAGLGERGFAYIFDFSLWLVSALACAFIYNFWGDLEQDLGALSFSGAIVLLLMFALLALFYDVIFETLGHGQTPGKRFMNIRVVRRDGLSMDLFGAFLRNVFRLLDILPAGYGVGICVLFWTKTHRLGDLVADTVVVSERGRNAEPLHFLSSTSAPPSQSVNVGALTDQRNQQWTPDSETFCLHLLERTRDLPDIYSSRLIEQALIDQGYLAKKQDQGPINRAYLENVLQHLAMQPSTVSQVLGKLQQAVTDLESALKEFRVMKRKARSKQTMGTNLHDALEQTIGRLDDAIRKTSTFLMQASQRSVPQTYTERASVVLFEAQRLRHVRRPVAERAKKFWGTHVPTAIFQEWHQIFTAAWVLLLASASGFVLAYGDVEIGRALVGDALAAQIEKGAVWTDTIEDQGMFGKAAVQIIINNVRVGLIAFVFGLFGGVGTLLVVISNGLHLGSVFGYAHSLDSADRLAQFVLAHGPVELSAICTAAAAGLCLGRAIVNPGARTRLVALREEGTQGFKLVMGASAAFVFIGCVEGFLSPGKAFPWQLNAAAGLCTWLMFFFWVKYRAESVVARHRE